MTDTIATRKPTWDKATTWRIYFEQYGFQAKVKMHSEREPGNHIYGLPPRIWNTYLVFVDRKRWFPEKKVIPCPFVTWLWGKTEDYDGPLSDLSWNGGPTMYEEETRANGQRMITIGDDYAHAIDDGRHDLYSLEYMQNAIEVIAKEAFEFFQKLNLPKDSDT